MNFSNLHKRAQSLPLNTIVIAILVVIVLLIIIVTFTDSFTDSNESLNQASGCTETNPLVSVRYENPKGFSIGTQGDKYEKVVGVPNWEQNDDTYGCYAIPKSNN